MKPAGHRHTATAIAVSPDGERLITGDMRGGVIVWDAAGPTPLAALRPPESVKRSRIRALAFSPAGRLAIASDWSGTVEIWDDTTFVRAFAATTGQVTAVAWTPDGALLTGGTDRSAEPDPDAPFDSEAPTPATITLWKGETAAQRFTGPVGMVGALAISADGAHVAAAVGAQVQVWAAGGKPVAQFGGIGDVQRLAFEMADGAPRLVALGSGGLRTARGADFAPDLPQAALKASAAGWIGADRVVAASYDGIRIHRRPALGIVGETAGRAYSVAASGDGFWIVLADAMLHLGPDGEVRARRGLKAK